MNDLRNLADGALLEAVQRQTFRYFWDGAHPASGMARDRQRRGGKSDNDLISLGGTGFGLMAIVVAVERGWVPRNDAMERIDRIVSFLEQVTRYHGMFPHFVHGRSGKTIRFTRKDDGGDCVETALLFQGLLCARQYLNRRSMAETRLREGINRLWRAIEWDWYCRDEEVLYWHWSPSFGWAMNCPVSGWNEGMLSYVLAAGSSTHPIRASAYHNGFARDGQMCNGQSFYGIDLPLGPDHGGPLFLAQYSFCGLDPRRLRDRYAHYWQQNVAHTRINYEHCVRNPHGHSGYGEDCWGLTSGHGPYGYVAHAPDEDKGVITPSAALSSLPYTPVESMRALRCFLAKPLHRIWGSFGFFDSFSENLSWFAQTYLAINQGPIIAMIENHRSGLLWELFMSAPEVREGLRRLGFVQV
ncbi:glucoamylase family protein [Mesorhizobium sp. WSM3860]|uniref:glucoamylase family protein n=1 Tax=Mesorhizobium sp. WSM3860 TaxID=2029403 RepID=UPI000BAEA631|nr:glucoamylase family protein [Mesorhizobium sp. WSM3860]PBC03720.1 beta-glucosidase [Mesorhizobium sp. WSM3860]